MGEQFLQISIRLIKPWSIGQNKQSEKGDWEEFDVADGGNACLNLLKNYLGTRTNSESSIGLFQNGRIRSSSIWQAENDQSGS